MGGESGLYARVRGKCAGMRGKCEEDAADAGDAADAQGKW